MLHVVWYGVSIKKCWHWFIPCHDMSNHQVGLLSSSTFPPVFKRREDSQHFSNSFRKHLPTGLSAEAVRQFSQKAYKRLKSSVYEVGIHGQKRSGSCTTAMKNRFWSSRKWSSFFSKSCGYYTYMIMQIYIYMYIYICVYIYINVYIIYV